MKLEDSDYKLLAAIGKTEKRLLDELRMISEGFPSLEVIDPATPGNGIIVITEDIRQTTIRIWEQFLNKGGKVVKMIPASGAASRMFKELFSFLESDKEKPDSDSLRNFFDNIEEFAFFPALNFIALSLHGKSVHSLIKSNNYKDIVRSLLLKEGLNYGALPKALLLFHKDIGCGRTPLEEHLDEAAAYATGKDKMAHLHFTVSANHLPLMKMKLEETLGSYTKKHSIEYDVTFSIQKPSTDTIAANPDGTPYRENGNLFFRPGGHGALIENLNDIDADIIFIKNIDNVVPDILRNITIDYKKILGGITVGVKQRIDKYCRRLKEKNIPKEELTDMLWFLRSALCVTSDKADLMDDEALKEYLFNKFNRPLRVCGVVKNTGEPGGGPFLVRNRKDSTISPQILESSQFDQSDRNSKKIMERATHFNPVDIVCAIKDFTGKKFNLPDFVDPDTGFISNKSRGASEIKALELPGLWNGAMSDWNTIFVEVPIETFNPVKTVNDLLRDYHKR